MLLMRIFLRKGSADIVLIYEEGVSSPQKAFVSFQWRMNVMHENKQMPRLYTFFVCKND